MENCDQRSLVTAIFRHCATRRAWMTKILCGWIGGDLLMFAIAGAIIGVIYKPSTSSGV